VSDVAYRYDGPGPGAVAWLDVSAEDSNGSSGRTRTGPLGLHISPMPQSRAPYFFRGARLRGTRCIWSASTVSGAELARPARATTPVPPDGSVHVLARVECSGTVFEPAGPPSHAVLTVIDAVERYNEQFLANTHLFTLNVPQAAIGLEPGMLAEMYGQSFDLTDFQIQLLRAAASLLLVGGELGAPSTLVGVDRYLAALTGLLLRTAVRKPSGDPEQLASVRARTDAIIFEQASDPLLTPATIATQLSVSLRQLYRAFNGTESPAARIRRRRLDRAAELLSARSPQPNVESVALECGFTSAEYFSRAFRREFGISPRAYRSAHRDASPSR
jgi:AraC-like DNA-binding protein